MIPLNNFEVTLEDIPNFEGIVGMTKLKTDLKVSMIEPLRNPALYDELGLAAGEKYLLYGPPGCGKSYFARAVAGELRCRCFELIPSTTLGEYYGAVNVVHEVFERARFTRPSVIIIDEVETLTRDRDDGGTAEFVRSFLNEMLIQFDNTRNDNSKIAVFGTTNAPWHIDGAFLREGRFGKAILTSPPNRTERIAYFRKLLSSQNLPDTAFDEMASLTRLFSYADIFGIVKKARQGAVKELIAAGKAPTGIADIMISPENLLGTAKLQFSSVRSWFEKIEAHAKELHESLLFPVKDFLREEKQEES